MLDFKKMLVRCTLVNITEDYSKSYSVNRISIGPARMFTPRLKKLALRFWFVVRMDQIIRENISHLLYDGFLVVRFK